MAENASSELRNSWKEEGARATEDTSSELRRRL
jgi:hypothetical protein